MRQYFRHTGHGIGLACVATSAWYMGTPNAGAATVINPSPKIVVGDYGDTAVDLNSDGFFDVNVSLGTNDGNVFITTFHSTDPFDVPNAGGGASSAGDGSSYQLYSPGQVVSFSGSFQMSLFRSFKELSSPDNHVVVQFLPGEKAATETLVLGQFALAYTDDGSRFGSLSFSDVAYETNAGDDTTVQPVPEPSSLAGLALGAAGLLARRRSRKA